MSPHPWQAPLPASDPPPLQVVGLEHFRGVFTLLSLLPHLWHFPSGSCSPTSSSSPSSCCLSPAFTHLGQLHSPMLPLGSPVHFLCPLCPHSQPAYVAPLLRSSTHTTHGLLSSSTSSVCRCSPL